MRRRATFSVEPNDRAGNRYLECGSNTCAAAFQNGRFQTNKVSSHFEKTVASPHTPKTLDIGAQVLYEHVIPATPRFSEEITVKNSRILSCFVLALIGLLAHREIPLCRAADGTPSAAPIRAYCIDFNWGPGGPNGYPQPGHWADADPKAHVAWYKSIGCNVIQTFCVSVQRLCLVQRRRSAGATRPEA